MEHTRCFTFAFTLIHEENYIIITSDCLRRRTRTHTQRHQIQTTVKRTETWAEYIFINYFLCRSLNIYHSENHFTENLQILQGFVLYYYVITQMFNTMEYFLRGKNNNVLFELRVSTAYTKLKLN
jgi:hypothetical protein